MGLVERADHLAARVDAFLDADDQLAWHDRARLVLVGQRAPLVDARTVDPLRALADQRRVLVALGRDQRDARSTALEQTVHRHGGRVPNGLDTAHEVIEREARLAGRLLHHLHEADAQVVRRRRHLPVARLAIEREHHVGERSSDVDVDRVHHTSLTASRSPRISSSPASSRSRSRSRSISISCVTGCPGGRYSVSTWVKQPGQWNSRIRTQSGSGANEYSASISGWWISRGSRWLTWQLCL